MNKIVKVVPVELLPEELRAGIAPGHTVEVTVRDLDGDDAPRRTAEEMLEKLERYVSAHGDSGATVDDAVERVRALRDEWS